MMQWRSLRKEEKEVFEDRAKKIAGEMLNRQQHEALTETADALHVHQSLSSPLLMTAASSVAPGWFFIHCYKMIMCCLIDISLTTVSC